MSRLAIPLTLRQRAIIHRLLSAQDRITHEQLAAATGLTVRVVRYNMPAVRAWFSAQAIRLASRPGLGIEIEASSVVRRKLVSALGRSLDQVLVLSGGQRRRAFLFQLLTSKAPMSYRNLAAQAGSSRSTLIHDVRRVQQWLNQYRITLVRKPRRGISLLTSEQARRLALVGVLHGELGDERWINLRAIEPENLAGDRSLPPYLRRYIDGLDLPLAAQLVLKIQNNLGQRLTPGGHATILTYLAVTIQALNDGALIEAGLGNSSDGTPEHKVARLLMQDVARRLDLEVPEPEAEVLAACLLGSEWEQTSWAPVPQVLPPGEPSPEALRHARHIVQTCAAQLHPLLNIDLELVTGMAFHLDPTLRRLRHGIPVWNPDLETVRGRYAEVYRSATDACRSLEQDLGVEVAEDEIGYITMYLAAALERIGTNRRSARPVVLVGDGNRAKMTLLRSRLEYELPGLEIVGIAEPDDLPGIELPRCELVVSYVPYKHPRIPTVRVSPFLPGEDIRSMRIWLTAKEAQERRVAVAEHARLGIVELLDPSSVTFHSTPVEWRIAVSLAAQPLLRTARIAPSYVEAMVKILEEFGPYMILAPGVILLHAKPSDGVDSLCFSLLVHRGGIDFGGNLGRVHVVFVLGAVDNQSHLTALFQLNDLIHKPGFVDAMRETLHPADALQMISSFLTSGPDGARPKKREKSTRPLRA